MKNKTLIIVAASFIGLVQASFAGKTYQATGPILELTDKKIVIQKDTEKWEIERTPETKITGTLKVGEKVTIHYTMTASSIETKPAKPEKK